MHTCITITYGYCLCEITVEVLIYEFVRPGLSDEKKLLRFPLEDQHFAFSCMDSNLLCHKDHCSRPRICPHRKLQDHSTLHHKECLLKYIHSLALDACAVK